MEDFENFKRLFPTSFNNLKKEIKEDKDSEKVLENIFNFYKEYFSDLIKNDNK